MDYTAVGDTTNVAARLQQAADRGRILVPEATHRLVEGHFHMRPLGHLSLKGKAEPVRAWEVISARAARTRLDVEAERGLTPYVGREREIRLLHECFERAGLPHHRAADLQDSEGALALPQQRPPFTCSRDSSGSSCSTPRRRSGSGPARPTRPSARRPHLVTNGGNTSATFLVLQGIGEYDFVPLLQPKEESK
jgi:hypothetical protein